MLTKKLTAVFIFAVVGIFIGYTNVVVATNIVENGLVSYWSFEEDTVTGDTVKDVVGNNDGTINGEFEVVEGEVGQGLKTKEGMVNYVEVASDALSKETTITVWAKAEEFSDVHYIFGHSTLPVWKDRIQIYSDNGDGQLDIGLGDSHARHTNVVLLETGTWYHIALVYTDTPDGDYEVYVDGKMKAEGSFTGINELIGFADISNNGGQTSRDQGWLGVVDEFCLYDRVLSEDEIKQNYGAEGLAVNPSGNLSTVWGKIKMPDFNTKN